MSPLRANWQFTPLPTRIRIMVPSISAAGSLIVSLDKCQQHVNSDIAAYTPTVFSPIGLGNILLPFDLETRHPHGAIPPLR